MIYRISLRLRIYLLLGSLVAANMVGAIVTLSYIARTQKLYSAGINQDIQALMAAEQLVTSLVMQKGYVTYYFLDGQESWIERLEEHHSRFFVALATARGATHIERARDILNEIESSYVRFIPSRDQVIRFYREDKREEGYARHLMVRQEFLSIYDLCDTYRQLFEDDIAQTVKEYGKAARFVTLVALAAIPGCVLIGSLLAYILIRRVLMPIREIAAGEDASRSPMRIADEVETLGIRVRSLVENVHHAQTKLDESREHLIQSEKLALVGKMAAGMAHSIRNPLTSVKMRLFSLERSLSLNPVQREDLDVISEEIRHIDAIVQNFLDFSKPPKLRFQLISPSDVVDMTLQLLRYRIESYGLTLELRREEKLPPVMADADQLKEVLSNLLLNALDAMSEEGHILITEEMRGDKKLGRIALIKVSDSGPGVPTDVQNRVFEPFFSTKEEGSGLGLSIAKRIVEEHGGYLNLNSQVGQGTTFEILLPCKEG